MEATMKRIVTTLAATALILGAAWVDAAFHLFRIDQVYSNADGSIQYVVMRESTGSNLENFWSTGASLRATPTGGTPQTIEFTSGHPSTNTASRSVLIATPGFAALHLVTPDFTMPAQFIPRTGGTLNYASVYDQRTLPVLLSD